MVWYARMYVCAPYGGGIIVLMVVVVVVVGLGRTADMALLLKLNPLPPLPCPWVPGVLCFGGFVGHVGVC